MLSTVTLAVLVAVLFAVLVPLRVTRVHIHNNISPTVELQAILDPQGSDTLELLQSRADSNSRLKLAFGLTNSFVSNDPIVRKEFLKNVGSILKVFPYICGHKSRILIVDSVDRFRIMRFGTRPTHRAMHFLSTQLRSTIMRPAYRSSPCGPF
jgi:hypothetical protein